MLFQRPFSTPSNFDWIGIGPHCIRDMPHSPSSFHSKKGINSLRPASCHPLIPCASILPYPRFPVSSVCLSSADYSPISRFWYSFLLGGRSPRTTFLHTETTNKRPVVSPLAPHSLPSPSSTYVGSLRIGISCAYSPLP